ncbi:hypothetical protein H4R21_004683, partial [Coemansia helicoidea]
MHGGAAAVALALALAISSLAAPLRRVGRRQADQALAEGYGLPDSTGDDWPDAVGDAQPDLIADDSPGLDGDAAVVEPDAADGQYGDDTVPDDGTSGGSVANLAGNSLTNIDDSVSVNNVDVAYPGDAELTGNTGTAVSGNSNAVMPIINAPVTVIVNSAEDADRLASHLTAPQVAGAAAGWTTDPMADHIQQLMAYALA